MNKQVLLEGNYLLLKDEGWNKLSDYADLTISVMADPDMLRGRLLERKIRSGKSALEAEHFVDFSDMYNVRTVIERSKDADVRLEVLSDGSYRGIL